MSPLNLLKAFIAAKDSNDERHEIREYAMEHRVDIAAGFGVTVEQYTKAVDDVGDDEQLARRLLATIKATAGKARAARALSRSTAAQDAADALGAGATWEGNRAVIDVSSLLGSVVTTRGTDVTTLACDGFEITLENRRLLAIAKLGRTDLSAYVDQDGLHVRWASGGLNLWHARSDRMTDRDWQSWLDERSSVTVNLSPAPRATAAELGALLEKISKPVVAPQPRKAAA